MSELSDHTSGNELDEVAKLLEAEGLLREPDDDERIWYRPDGPGVPQPEITEYGTTPEAVRRVLDEARVEAAMAWAEDRKSRAEVERLRAAYEALAIGRDAESAANERLRAGLIALLAWVDGWRDEYDGVPEKRWRVGFTNTTPELVLARSALDEGEVDKSAPKSTKRASDLNRGHVQMTGDPLDPLGLFEAAGPTLGEDDPAALDEEGRPCPDAEACKACDCDEEDRR